MIINVEKVTCFQSYARAESTWYYGGCDTLNSRHAVALGAARTLVAGKP